MAEVVFVLGAGASVGAGAPLMRNFLDVADDLHRLNNLGNDKQHFERVFEAIAALKTAQAQISLDTHNLESVFSAFDMGRVLGRLGPNDDPDGSRAARDSFVRVIARTLQEKVILSVGSSGDLLPDRAYDELASVIAQLQSKGWYQTRGPPAVLTLNYDLALDHALYARNIGCSYGLDPRNGMDGVRVLKLHGSLNWTRCAHCQSVTEIPILELVGECLSLNRYIMPKEPVALYALERIDRATHCDMPCTGPMLVPPTWSKGDHPGIQNVWRNAARELSDARYIFFVGYSFPDTDQYVRYLLALGLAGHARLRRICVVDVNDEPFNRLCSWVSPDVRRIVNHVKMPFGEAVGAFPGMIMAL